MWKSITVNNAQVVFRLYNDGNGKIPGSVTIVDFPFSIVQESAIEMAVPSTWVIQASQGWSWTTLISGPKLKTTGLKTRFLRLVTSRT